MIVTDIKIGA